MNLFAFKKFNTSTMRRKELKHNITKFFLSNKFKSLKSDKILKQAYKNKYFFKQGSLSYFRRSCLISGNCRSVFRFFKLSRHRCRPYASKGIFVGLRKASF